MSQETPNEDFNDAARARRTAYADLLRKHDWGYQDSDDDFRWKRGSAQHREIQRLQKLCDADWQIWNTIVPPEYAVRPTPFKLAVGLEKPLRVPALRLKPKRKYS